MRLTGLLAGLAALAGAASARADCKLGQLVEIPITLRGSSPETIAKINGREARFTVDSGAFYSIISPGVAAENKLKLSAAPFGMRLVGVGGSADMDVTKVKSFTLAGIDLPNIEFIVGGSEVGGAGVIGQNVLHIGDVEFDLPHGKISLYRPDGCLKTMLAYWATATDPVSQIRLEDEPRRFIIGSVKINGQNVSATFDSGAYSTVISLATAHRLGIRIDGPGVESAGFGHGFGGRMVRSWIVPINEITVGGETLRNTHLRVEDLGATEMLVGDDFFLAHRIYVSHSQGKMYFTYVGGSFFDAREQHGHAVTGEGKALDLKDTAAAPSDADGLSRQAMALLAKGDKAGALADLDKAIALAPSEPRFLLEHARIEARSGHADLALADLDKLIAAKPDAVDALLLRADLQRNAHRPERAMADYDAASALLDKASDSRFGLAEAYLAMERPAKALPEIDQWIAAHPVDSRQSIALNSRCWARALLGQDLVKALSDCNAALKTAPRREMVLDSRGLVHLRMGDAAAAVKDYDGALAIDPKVAWSLYGRGLAKAKLGDKAGSDADIAAAKALAPRIADRAARFGITS